MAVVYDWQWFEGCTGLKEILAIRQMFIWQGFGLFYFVCLLCNCGWKGYIVNVSRKCTLKIKYGLGLKILQLKLT